jgi:hypothetical protein
MNGWPEIAASNNAEWCDLVCAACGIRGQIAPDAWTSAKRTPDLFPDAVTLVPSPSVPSLLSRIDVGPGCSVKDSFAALDLGSAGFRRLFDAQWIVAEPSSTTGHTAPPAWSSLRDPRQFRWLETLHTVQSSQTGLPASVLGNDDVLAAARMEDGSLSGGALFNRSEQAVGISNVFSLRDDGAPFWRECLELSAAEFPAVPVVGYESGEALRNAEAAGFRAVGPLRVWIMD